MWAGAGRRDFVLDASLYVLVIAVLRRKVDNYIDGGGGGFGVGHDDDPPSSGGGVASSLLLHRVLISVPRGPLTPLSSRAPLIRAIERTAKQVATDRATGTATAGGTRAPAQ